MSNPNKCVLCGVVIPEGYQYCPNCEWRVKYDTAMKEYEGWNGKKEGFDTRLGAFLPGYIEEEKRKAREKDDE